MATTIVADRSTMEPIRRGNMTSEVMERIKDYIANNGLSPKDMLPPEAELARMLNVGRRVVREALKSMEAMGMIDIKVGKGLYVSKFDYSNIARHLSYALRQDAGDLHHLLEARLAMESAVLDVLVDKITDSQLARLEEIGDRLEAAETIQDDVQADCQFHVALAEMTGNPLLIEFCCLLNQFFSQVDEIRRGPSKKGAAEDVVEHRSIIAALRNRQVHIAKEILSEHVYAWEE